MSIIRMTDLSLENKRVLIREDFNVPLKHGKITSDARIQAAIPTIEMALEAGAKIILMSHLGRPEEGRFDEAYSLAPVADYLSHALKKPIRLEQNWLSGVDVSVGEIVLCENVRFCKGEKENCDDLSKKMAALCDIFVMDAFGVVHRKQSSTYGVAKFASVACAGPLIVAELEALTRALDRPTHPVVAIVAGSKVSTKLSLLEALIKKADQIIVGGGIANTFLAAKGFPIGKSLFEAELVPVAQKILEIAATNSTVFPLPIDVVVAKEFSPNAEPQIKLVTDVLSDEMVLDVGPQTAALFSELLLKAGTTIWNGPVGVFEFDAFAAGTKVIAEAIAESHAFSIAGGGDTVAAIEKFDIASRISYISTGGGAFLKFLEGKKLPAIAILEQRAVEMQG